MGKFREGSRVRVKEDHYENHLRGKVGTVVEDRSTGNVGIEFDTYIDGHNCNGHGKMGFCWYMTPDSILLTEQGKIVITTDGKTTLARLYKNNKVVKSAEAKCSPEDKFEFIIGAKIALERLTSEDIDESEINVGDNVEVIDSGLSYTIYTNWFKDNNIDIEIAARFAYNKTPDTGEVYEVIEKHPHCLSNNMLYCIRSRYGEVYLINKKGLKKIKEAR